MKADFLLEIGVEEMPARFLGPALEGLREQAAAALAEERLPYDALKTLGTPRRLTLFVEGLARVQERLTTEVKGPPRMAAFDVDGALTKAGAGFARSQGVNPADFVIRPVGKVEYVFAVKSNEGLAAESVLPGVCVRIIRGLNFPRPMRWGSGDFRFARPIRWLAALHGTKVIPFEIAGVRSGRFTFGHRFLSSGRQELDQPADYEALLEAHFVLVDPDRRRRVIREQIRAAAAAEGGRVDEDPALLDEVVNILEYPTAFCGRFADDYLELPEPVLVTPMREHQRYFPVRDAGGRLMARFVAVHNGTTEHIDIVRAGNEKVLKARLEDAAFFFREDQAVPPAERVEQLKKVVFRDDLGSVFQKVERLVALSGVMAGMLGVSEADRRRAARAALLCKTDLVTNMVFEFPELQGVMGREYALRAQEEPGVAEAILEHYLPRGAGDAIPATLPGRILALADRIDNLVGAFGLGIQPTGSADPYALRRQALAICVIVLDGPLHLNLNELLAKAHTLYGSNLKAGLGEVIEGLDDFFRQRLRGLFRERGLRYDVIDAVLALPFGDVRDLWERARAVSAFREREAFPDIMTAFTRAHNLARKAAGEKVDPALFTEPAEKSLHQAMLAVRGRVTGQVRHGRYPEALNTLAELRAPVDTFFDDVLVMADDPAVRANRLGLLRNVAQTVQKVADISKLVV